LNLLLVEPVLQIYTHKKTDSVILTLTHSLTQSSWCLWAHKAIMRDRHCCLSFAFFSYNPQGNAFTWTWWNLTWPMQCYMYLLFFTSELMWHFNVMLKVTKFRGSFPENIMSKNMWKSYLSFTGIVELLRSWRDNDVPGRHSIFLSTNST